MKPMIAGPEVRAEFRSLEAWEAWLKDNPSMLLTTTTGLIADLVRQQGLVDPLSGDHYPGSAVTVNGPNYRESLSAGALIARHRAVLLELVYRAGLRPALLGPSARGYAPEAVTAFALYLRSRFPRFIGSEYATSEEERTNLLPIVDQDLLRLSFRDGLFDWVVSNDVFEHVPDLDLCLAEVARVLAPEGILIATFPFAFGQDESIVKSRLADGNVVHLMPPEYHGDPMRPDKGSLVFEIPGWDIIQRSLAAGFRDASFVLHSSTKHGITGMDLAGVFVFCAIK